MSKADYGIDAAGVIRNLFIIGAVGIAVGLLTPAVHLGPSRIALRGTFTLVGLLCAVEGLLMILYSKLGKFRHRDRILKRLQWKGDERVLDVGTGRGLLIIGAARCLTSGHAIGIDIWNTEDSSDNSMENALRNAESEGVRDKIEIRSEDVQQLSFGGETFDVVLSNLCLHNIRSAAGRDRAVKEIARVLNPGGKAVISDFKNVGRYARAFGDLGFEVSRGGPYIADTFPPLWIVEARKVASAGRP